MEPAGLAIGLLGLAGLFNTCLDVLDKFDAWRDYGSESTSLTARFKAHKLQLERWGQAVGFEKGTLSDQHDKFLDDPRTLSTVEELLSAIKDICGYDDDTSPISTPMSTRHAHPRTHLESKRQKLGWALRNKAKRISQVEQFSSIVEILHKLIPINGEFTRGDGYTRLPNDTSLDRGSWLPEFGRILSRIESEIESETRRDLQTWLLGDHIPNEIYEINIQRRMESSCEWILNRHWFLDWSSTNFPKGHAKILWINGPAGFGKSILCTKIIDHLSYTLETPVAHFFFSTDIERGDPFVVVRSWVAQLMSHPIGFELIQKRWTAQQGQKATRGDIIDLLRETIIAIPGCTFIMDGLDECSWLKENQVAGDTDSISALMEALGPATVNSATRFMIVSRDEPEIRTTLPDHSHDASVTEHKITPDDVRSDVVSYSRSIVHRNLPKKADTVKERLSQKLADRCNGQFLWVKMQGESLPRHSWKSQKELEQVIMSTPTGLEHTYERNWMKILKLPDEDRDRAVSLLRWTTFSLRPLTVSEMTEALLISEHCDEVRVDELPENIDTDYIDNGISLYCGSLLEIRTPQANCDAELRTVHLAHFSVKQYLLYSIPTYGRLMQLNGTMGCFTELAENTLLSKLCLRYVNCLTVWQKDPRAENDQVFGSFLDYAASSWQQHASLGDPMDSEVVELVNRLFDTRKPNWALWREWVDSIARESGEEPPRFEDTPTNPSSPMYYAARFGLIGTVKFLIYDRKHSANEKGVMGRTALAAACEKGHFRIGGMLLGNGADLNIADNDGRTPLYSAASNGHLAVVKLLLGNGADVNVSDNKGFIPLHSASSNGQLEVVKLLLDYGADAKVTNKHGWTPVSVAASNGHLEVVRLLLDNGADINVPDSRGFIPLHSASSNGQLEVVKLLLHYGADAKVTNKHGWTPVSVAASNGHLEVVRLLLDNGADINVSDRRGFTPLHSASSNGHLEVVKLFLGKGADFRLTNNNGWTPLYSAASNGHLEIVTLLLDNQADITVANNDGWTPVSVAASNGHVEVVRLLLENGANITVANNDGWTPVSVAASNGYVEVVRLLLENGANIAVANNDGWTPVSVAASNGHVEVVRLLLENGVNITVANNDGWTPVSVAASNGQLEIVKLLLDNGANITVANNEGWTPLHSASSNDHLEVVRLLLYYGADAKVTNKIGWTPVSVAASNGHLEVVRLLFDNGADVNVSDSRGFIPLHSASSNGQLEVVKLLLNNGANITVANNDGWTPVSVAASNGHLETVKLILDNGANPNVADNDARTPLYSAASNGHIGVVRLLLDNGANITVANNGGWTPVSVAASNGHVEVVKLLLDNGADLNIGTNDARTPLYSAASNDHLEVVKLLLNNGADVNNSDSRGFIPLHSASSNGQLEIVKLLLDYGADAKVTNKHGWTPVSVAASNGHLEIVKLLLDNGANPNVADNDERTPLYSAASNGHLDVVKLLLDNGADAKVTSNDGWTPVNMASLDGHLELVKLLLNNGADTKATNKYGWTPVGLAAINGHLGMVRLLLDNGANITAANNDGWTPVNVAASNGHLEIVKLLLDNGANIAVASNDGWTPLYSAALNGHLEMLRLLLDNGANVNVFDGWGFTPLHSASSNGHLEVVKLLLNHGANITVVEKRGCTALHIASEKGHVDVVKFLFRSLEPSLHVRNSDGRTPLFFAAARGQSEVIRLLLSYDALPNVKDRYGTSPLCAAIRNGHQEAAEFLLSLTETTADFKDGLGRNLAYWATKSGCASIIDLVRQWALRMDIEICERDLTVGCDLAPFDQTSRSCDVCTRYISSGCAYHCCEVCHDFDICLECYGLCIQCRDASHDWVLREPTARPHSGKQL